MVTANKIMRRARSALSARLNQVACHGVRFDGLNSVRADRRLHDRIMPLFCPDGSMTRYAGEGP